MFTVIIPLFNKERYIKRAVTSVLRQTFLDFELIVVDDMSRDNSLKELLEISDSRIKLIQLKKNKGVSNARNQGIANAKFNYISFLDADDEWMEDHLSTIFSLIGQYPEAGMYTARHITISEQGKKLDNDNSSYKLRSYCTTNFVGNYKADFSLINSSSVCLSRKVLIGESGIFPNGRANGEDIYVWLKVSLNFKVAFSIKKTVTIYRNALNRSVNRDWSVPYYVEYFLPLVGENNNVELKSFIRKGALLAVISEILNDNHKSVTIFKFIKFVYFHDKFLAASCAILLIFPSRLMKYIRLVKQKVS